MTDYDQATLMLLADLESAVPSPKRDAILDRARACRYRSGYPNAYDAAQRTLCEHLLQAGLSELAANVKRGKYYDSGDEARLLVVTGRYRGEDALRDIERLKQWVEELAAECDAGKITLDEFNAWIELVFGPGEMRLHALMGKLTARIARGVHR